MRLDRMITAVDAHACGEPGRVIVGGVLDVPGETMFQKKLHLEQHADSLRKLMLREPRGYPALCCNLVLPPTKPEADAGFVIMEQMEYPPMSGSNIICVATVLIETGMVPVQEPVTELVLEAPAGLVPVRAQVANNKVTNVTFENVPAFATHIDAAIDVPELGEVRVDVAYGGMFYVIADAEQFGLSLVADEGARIARIGEMVKIAAREQLPVVHPENEQISGVTISQLSGRPHDAAADRRNAVVVSSGVLDWDRPETWTGVLDRSPCGTGTCAKMATMYSKSELDLKQDFVHESVLGTVFTGRLLREADVGGQKGVVPALSGRAWITGFSQYVVDAEDPFPEGFTVGDIWGSSIG
ncbi:MAG: proline racemase family protein [Gemmatimonadota bacterium]|nr:MAG: proline racemase family protein [Gemmatimonadota bacterium]